MEAAVTEHGPWSHHGKKRGGHRVEWPGDYDTPPFQGSPHQSPGTTVPEAGTTWLDFLLCVVFRVTGRTLDTLQSRKQEVKKGTCAIQEHVGTRNRNLCSLDAKPKLQRDLTSPCCLSFPRKPLAVTIAMDAANGTFFPPVRDYEMCSWKTHIHTQTHTPPHKLLFFPPS